MRQPGPSLSGPVLSFEILKDFSFFERKFCTREDTFLERYNIGEGDLQMFLSDSTTPNGALGHTETRTPPFTSRGAWAGDGSSPVAGPVVTEVVVDE